MAAVLRPIGELATPEAITEAVAASAAAVFDAETAQAAAELAADSIPTAAAITQQVQTDAANATAPLTQALAGRLSESGLSATFASQGIFENFRPANFKRF